MSFPTPAAMENAPDRFLGKLVDVTEPEAKRKTIGAGLIRVFEEEARKIGNEVSFLAQGTIYPDILESKDGVKAHHNVGGLPDDLQFELCEPVKLLYKDEVRVVGCELGLPENMVEPSLSPALAWAFAASVLLPATVSRRCARQMRSFAKKSTRLASPSGSTSPPCPTSAPPACARASALTIGRASSAASTPSTS